MPAWREFGAYVNGLEGGEGQAAGALAPAAASREQKGKRMRYCPRCKTDLFGGSICDCCGGRLVEKQTKQAPKVVHVTQDMIMGGPRHLKSELAQSKAGRVFRLVLEIIAFCAIFYAVSWIGHVIGNFLSVQMSDRPDETVAPIKWGGSGVRYYLYVGWAMVTLLTIKLRWAPGK